MQAIDWESQTTPAQRKEVLPTTMTYRYKRDKNATKYQARCSIRGDRMTLRIHYDPEKTATYMADRTTVRIIFAKAASMNMEIEHFDITGANLHEEYKHTKKYPYGSHRDSTDSTSTKPHTANSREMCTGRQLQHTYIPRNSTHTPRSMVTRKCAPTHHCSPAKPDNTGSS